MKRLGFILLFGFFAVSISQGQVDEKKEVYEKEHIKDKTPVPYVPVREADVPWSKTIWRIIDLRHKMNLSFYYPTEPIGNRMSLIDLLLYGVKNEGLNVYDADSPDATTEFDVLMTQEQVDVAMDAMPDTIMVQDPESGEMEENIVEGEPKTHEVQQFLIKEKWYFDKQHSTRNVRIVGLCPIRLYQKEDNPDLLRKKVFWVYYPEARGLLANHEIFNRHNDAQRISFDDRFLQRSFQSYVIQESNVYNNRGVNEYTMGVKTLLESEKIEEFLFEVEHDLWVY